MGSIWGRQDPDRPQAGPMNFAIWVCHITTQVYHQAILSWYIYSGIKTAQWRWQSGKLVTSGDTRVLHPRSHRCYQHKHISTYKRCLWAWQCYAVNKVICWDLYLMIRISLHTYPNSTNFSYQIDNESVCWVQCFSEHANWDRNIYIYIYSVFVIRICIIQFEFDECDCEFRAFHWAIEWISELPVMW